VLRCTVLYVVVPKPANTTTVKCERKIFHLSSFISEMNCPLSLFVFCLLSFATWLCSALPSCGGVGSVYASLTPRTA
jgi:hypothetical protein